MTILTSTFYNFVQDPSLICFSSRPLEFGSVVYGRGGSQASVMAVNRKLNKSWTLGICPHMRKYAAPERSS